MDHITVRHIVEAVSGTLLCGDADTELKHISIDSRSMRGADLFVPLIGEKSDAHRFLVQAMDNGAAAALTSEHEAAPEGFHGALIQVKDTKLALQTIVMRHLVVCRRQQLCIRRIIAILHDIYICSLVFDTKSHGKWLWLHRNTFFVKHLHSIP